MRAASQLIPAAAYSTSPITKRDKHLLNLENMSRQYYGAAEAIDQLQHPNRPLPLSMSQPLRESPRSFPISRHQSRASPLPDSESEKGGNSTRKRISLAVSRSKPRACRRRHDADNLDSVHGVVNERSSAVVIKAMAFARIVRLLEWIQGTVNF